MSDQPQSTKEDLVKAMTNDEKLDEILEHQRWQSKSIYYLIENCCNEADSKGKPNPPPGWPTGGS